MLWQLVDSPTLNTQSTARPGRVRFAIVGAAEASAIAARIATGVLARFRKRPEYFEPDLYASEAPFLSDRWPGQ